MEEIRAKPSLSRPAYDLAVLACLLALIYGVVFLAREWSAPLQPTSEIHLEARYLPLYTWFSLSRGLIAYGFSFLFTLIVGYAAARNRTAERILLPMLDIGQSIPVLGFLPGLVLGLVALFPHRNIGLELASVLMIFTGQVWNMAFSFYGSLKAVPEDLKAVTRLCRLGWWERFVRLDLSFAATGLIWNSMISMAGGWFFLTVSEAFVLGKQDFRVPGLGSYMSVAIERGNTRAQLFAVLAMIAMIIFLDWLVWRPIVAWSQKFSTDESERSEPTGLQTWLRFRRSAIFQILCKLAGKGLALCRQIITRLPPFTALPPWNRKSFLLLFRILGVAAVLGAIFAVAEYIHFIKELSAADWRNLLGSAWATFLRVAAAVGIASLWTVPVGVFIGRNPRWARQLQPIIQIVASFPAPMIFPLVISLILALGGTLGIGSTILLMLSSQWYILFNAIAGTNKIPAELWELSRLSNFSWRMRWQKLILPGLFPYLVTGWITAMGGAWNASIIAEYLQYKGHLLTTTGLGALISQATEAGQFRLLAAAVAVMILIVVGLNRFVWRRLGELAQNRFAFEG